MLQTTGMLAYADTIGTQAIVAQGRHRGCWQPVTPRLSTPPFLFASLLSDHANVPKRVGDTNALGGNSIGSDCTLSHASRICVTTRTYDLRIP